MTVDLSAEFVIFKTEFERYRKLFGLDGYNVYFTQESLNGNYADITVNPDSMAACVRMANNIGEEDANGFFPGRCAKHEAIHLLVGRLSEGSEERFISAKELDAATEELVNKLTVLIP